MYVHVGEAAAHDRVLDVRDNKMLFEYLAFYLSNISSIRNLLSISAKILLLNDCDQRPFNLVAHAG